MHFGRLYGSGHGIIRLFFLHIQLIYNIAQTIFTWFSLASYYLTTVIIMNLVGTPEPLLDYHGWPFGDKVTPIFNHIIGYIYVAFLILQFIAGLILLALITIYGLNFLASFIYLDPWHMFHSFPQYLFLMSTYINVLMVYAFNNWHDVSWGTKGSDKGDSLPSANIIKGKGDVMVEEVEQEQEDIDSRFEKVVHRALAPMAKTGDDKPAKKDTDDSYRSFRTGLVYSWLLSLLTGNRNLIQSLRALDRASL